MSKKLWAIYLYGPDEYRAMPSEAVARAVAEKHNQWLSSEDGIQALKKIGLTHGDCRVFSVPWSQVNAVPWPFEPEAHAKEMLDFDYEEWGLERD